MRRRDAVDRGSITLELAILAPALLVMFALVLAVGRITTTGAAVEQSAAAAARAASLARSAGHAEHAAQAAAQASLSGGDVDCADLRVALELGGFAAEVGTAATVTASVSCAVPLGDLAVPGLPGWHTLEASMTSPLDRYRARQ